MTAGNASTQQRQANEASPQPRAVLGIGGVFEVPFRVTGYSVVRILIVASVPGTLSIFERVQEAEGQPVTVFTRTLGPLATVPSVGPPPEIGIPIPTEQICLRHVPCGDILLARFVNGGVAQLFFNMGVDGQPMA